MWIGKRYLDGKVSLGGSQIRVRVVFRPRRLARNCEVCAVANAGHRCQKSPQPCRVGIESREGRRGGVILCLVLRLPRSQPFGQMVPESEEPSVGHLEHATEVAWLISIEKEVRVWSIPISVLRPVQKSQSHQGIQKIAGGARMQS